MIGGSSDRTGSEPAETGRYAVLIMDELALLIPQHQVHALEPAFDVQRTDGQDAGRIALSGADWPVYCLSEDLRPVSQVPEGRRICVLLESGADLLGVLCDHVVMIEQVGLDVLPLPQCMHTPDTPIRGLLIHDDRVMCATSAEDLLDCVGLRQGPVDDAGPSQRLQGGVS